MAATQRTLELQIKCYLCLGCAVIPIDGQHLTLLQRGQWMPSSLWINIPSHWVGGKLVRGLKVTKKMEKRRINVLTICRRKLGAAWTGSSLSGAPCLDPAEMHPSTFSLQNSPARHTPLPPFLVLYPQKHSEHEKPKVICKIWSLSYCLWFNGFLELDAKALVCLLHPSKWSIPKSEI